MYVLSDASGSRTKSYQSVVTACMWRSKKDKTGAEKHVNRRPGDFSPATYVASRIAEYFELLCALTRA